MYIFSDLTQAEIIVPASHVTECSDVSAGLETLGQYALYDLVTVDRTQAACVVKVEHSSFKLLSTTNEELSGPLGNMGRKKSSKGVVALDLDGSKIEVNSPVTIIDGPRKDKRGFVKHIFKSFVFVHDVKDRRPSRASTFPRARQCRFADGAAAKPSLGRAMTST